MAEKRHLHGFLGLVCLVALTCSWLGAASFGSVSAAPASGPGPSSPKSFQPDPCIAIFIYHAFANNSNEGEVNGNITNDCPFTLASGRTDYFFYMQGCPGVGRNGETYSNFRIIDRGTALYFDVSFTGECEVCENGKPVDWPPFSVFIQIDASGTGISGQRAVDTGTAEATAHFSNSSAYSFPCP